MYQYCYPSYFRFTPYNKMPAPEQAAPLPFGTTSGSPVISTPPPSPTIKTPLAGFQTQQGPPVTTDMGYTQAYLKTKIGRRVRIEFLIGTGTLTDRIGTLVDVGISYIVIKLVESDDLMLGDIYAIKFVTFYK